MTGPGCVCSRVPHTVRCERIRTLPPGKHPMDPYLLVLADVLGQRKADAFIRGSQTEGGAR